MHFTLCIETMYTHTPTYTHQPFLFLLTPGLVDVAVLCGYLQKLWGFLQKHSVPLREESHLCCWVSLLFGEQDDDMMEAAKALLSIFLYSRYASI